MSKEFEIGQDVKIDKNYGGGSGTITDRRGSFYTVDVKRRGQEIHQVGNLKAKR